MLEVVTFLWSGGRADYTWQNVNTLYNMVGRNYQNPFRFTCVTNEPDGISEEIRVIPDKEDHALARPDTDYYRQFGRQSCYRRLRLYGPDAEADFGKRILCLDLDMVILKDVTADFDRKEDVVFLENASTHPNMYNFSMQLLTAGSRPELWEDFDADITPRLARDAGYMGTDQAWGALCLGPDEAVWTHDQGFLNWRMHVHRNGGVLPEHAKLVSFAGRVKPWQILDTTGWVSEHYR